MSFEAYSRNASNHGGKFSNDSPTSSNECEEDFGYDFVSPTQLLSLAIRKRREQYEEKDCDLKRQILHTGMIRSLCKYLGEGRAKRRRSRHRSSRRKASKRRWDEDSSASGEKQGQNDDNLDKLNQHNDGGAIEKKSADNPPSPSSKTLGGSGSDEDSGFESSSPTCSPPSPRSPSSSAKIQVVPVDAMDTSVLPLGTPRALSYDFIAPLSNGDDGIKSNATVVDCEDSLGVCAKNGGSAKRPKFSDQEFKKSVEDSTADDFMACDPFGLDNLCTPPPNFGGECSQDGLPVHYSVDLCDSTWTFNGRVKKYSAPIATNHVSSSFVDYCVTSSSGYSSLAS